MNWWKMKLTPAKTVLLAIILIATAIGFIIFMIPTEEIRCYCKGEEIPCELYQDLKDAGFSKGAFRANDCYAEKVKK